MRGWPSVGCALVCALIAGIAGAQDAGRALDARRAQRIRLTTWGDLPTTQGSAVLGASAVGLLAPIGVPGWGQPPGDDHGAGTYGFSTDRSYPTTVYFEGDRGRFAMTPYRAQRDGRIVLELPSASMLRPGDANDHGLTALAHVVELAVNRGVGAQQTWFEASAVRVLDGTAALPLRAGPALLAAQARTDAIVRREQAVFARGRRGAVVDSEERGVRATWREADRVLESMFSWTLVAHRGSDRIETVMSECPECPCDPEGRCAPCVRCVREATRVRHGEARTIRMAVVHEIDASGALLRETIFAARIDREPWSEELPPGR